MTEKEKQELEARRKEASKRSDINAVLLQYFCFSKCFATDNCFCGTVSFPLSIFFD